MMKPIGNRVLIERQKPEQSLIIRTDEPKSHKAKVLAVGRDVDPEITVGAMVILGQYAGSPCGEYEVVTDKDVLCLLSA